MAKPNNANHPAPHNQQSPRRAPRHAPSPELVPANTNEHSSAPRIVGRRYHLYSPSVFYIIVTIFIGIGAFNAQNNLLFFVFGVTLATLIVSGIISGTMMMGVSVRRVVMGEAEVGRPVPIAYRVSNLNRRLPIFAVSISEWPQSTRARKAKDAKRDGSRHDAPDEQHTGRLGQSNAFATFVPGGGSILVPADATPLRAGHAELRGFEVSTVFPFGIARKSVRFAQRATLTIRHPNAPVSGDTLASLKAAGAAQRIDAVAKRAEGEEFFGIREYNPGDPMRLIAWRASARSGDLRTRLHASPPRPSIRLLLDLEGLDDTPQQIATKDERSKPNDPLGQAITWPLRVMGFLDDTQPDERPMLSDLDRALALAGSLAMAMLDKGFAVQIEESTGRFHTPLGSGNRQRERILSTLALRRDPGNDPSAGTTTTHQRERPALTLRLSTGRASASTTPGAPAHATEIAWTYDQLDAAITPHTLRPERRPERHADRTATTDSAPPAARSMEHTAP